MLSEHEFLKMISQKEQDGEIPIVPRPIQIIAWSEFTTKREQNKDIQNAKDNETQYQIECDLATEIIHDLISKIHIIQ